MITSTPGRQLFGPRRAPYILDAHNSETYAFPYVESTLEGSRPGFGWLRFEGTHYARPALIAIFFPARQLISLSCLYSAKRISDQLGMY